MFHFSSEPYKEQTIIPFLERHLNEDTWRKLLPDITIHYLHSAISAKQQPFQFMEFIFRKSAHLFVYGMFAIVMYVAFIPFRFKAVRGAAASLAVVACIACFDEWNQKYTAQRTSTILDVFVDVTGGLIFLIIALLLIRWIKISIRRKSAL
nr:VanZ family protein [Paenibacillus sp. OV219]